MAEELEYPPRRPFWRQSNPYVMGFIFLDDPAFRDFNFSEVYDPALRPGKGPDHRELYRMVIEARRGLRVAAQEFAAVMDRTLTPEALESFQRTLGARPIAFRDWFYSKLYQFLAILLHDRVQVATNSLEGHGPPRTEEPWREGEGVLEGIGRDVHPDEIERAFYPSAPGLYDWDDLVRRSTQASQGQRLAAAMEFVESCAQQRVKTRRLDLEKGKRPRGDEDIEERDQLIAAQLMKGVSRDRICRLLDRKRSPVTENMREQGIDTWKQAWEDVEFRRDVQSMFSKAQRRFTSRS